VLFTLVSLESVQLQEKYKHIQGPKKVQYNQIEKKQLQSPIKAQNQQITQKYKNSSLAPSRAYSMVLKKV